MSIDFFYNHLDGGSWIEVGDYGYCWQPGIAVSNRSWRPYADGYWAYTDLGWTWVSYEDFGWATYHYGRWARLRDHGWVWVPGYEWGPAWVSWRTGGDYVGWAPLPPRRRGYGGGEVVYEGRPITGYVDIEFDIGPAYYNFVDIRYIGAPVLREHIYEPSRNVTYINQTVNVTNITYNNSTVYNYGPDYNTMSAYSARPIQRLTLERQTPTDLNAAVQSGALTKVQGDKLVVAAPNLMEKPQQPVAPPTVKTKIEQPNIETGWVGITDPDAKAQIQEKMKKEDRKSIPRPQIPPKNPDALNAAAPAGAPPGGMTTAPVATDVAPPGTTTWDLDRKGKGKGNDKRGRDNGVPVVQPQEVDGSAPPQPADATAAGNAKEQRGRGDKNKDRRARDQVQPAIPPQQPAADDPAVTGAPDAGAAPAVQERGRGRGNRGPQMPPSAPPTAPAEEAAANAAPADAPVAKPEKERGPRRERDRDRLREEINAARGNRPADLQPPPDAPDRGLYVPNAGAPNEPDAGGRGRGKQKRERVDIPQPGPAPDVAPPPQAPPREMMQERGRGRRERQEMPPPDIAPAPQAAPREVMQERGRGRRDRPEMPPQIAPPPQTNPGGGGPPPPPEGRGKPERKKKKDDGGGEEQ